MPERPPEVSRAELLSVFFSLCTVRLHPTIVAVFFFSLLFRFFMCSDDSILFCSSPSEKCTVRERPFKAAPRRKIV